MEEQPLWKKWWVWIIAVFVLFMVLDWADNTEDRAGQGPVKSSQEEVDSYKERIEEVLTEEDMMELQEITWMAIGLLPDDDINTLLDLHDKFYDG